VQPDARRDLDARFVESLEHGASVANAQIAVATIRAQMCGGATVRC
jgi:hypothetical protein